MLKLSYSSKFKKDYLRMEKRGLPIEALRTVVTTLQQGHLLDPKYKDHALKGNWRSYRECHIRPDWLLIYKIDKKELTLALVRTGSHADLLDM